MGSKHARRAIVVVGVLALALAAVFATASAGKRAATPPPNIVFVLTDDLAWNLVQYMPHVERLAAEGVTFTNYVVTDSLCCPSRSSIFTGLFPHDSGVFTNGGTDGGYAVFKARGLENKTYAVALRARGYMTSMMGKYLNGYDPSVLAVPPGWSDWHVAGNGYPEFNYDLNENGKLAHFGGPSDPANYLTDVLSTRAASFVNQAADARKPFAIEIATFAPHGPYTPAPRDANAFPGLTAPRTASFDANNVNPPRWLGQRAPLRPMLIDRIDTGFRKRAQAVQAVDKMIGELEDVLTARGLADNTYIVFSSDNGYHMGQHRLRPGKQTAFDTDIRVPLIVAGPGVPHGRRITKVAENIDLYPTFLELGGGTAAATVDGHSLVPLLHGQAVPRWRTAALVEHHGPTTSPTDPDFESGTASGNPTTYQAVRLANASINGTVVGNAVYVEYLNGDREYYDINKDAEERTNVYQALSAPVRAQLHAIAAALTACHGSTACWAAARPR